MQVYKQQFLELIDRQESQRAFTYLTKRIKPLEGASAQGAATRCMAGQAGRAARAEVHAVGQAVYEAMHSRFSTVHHCPVALFPPNASCCLSLLLTILL